MTGLVAIDRLVAFGPVIIQPHTRTVNHCVLATAIGCDVLARVGIEAVPLSVRVTVANKVWLDGVLPEGEPDWAAIKEAGGWLIDTGCKDDPQTGTVDAYGWYGHLVIHVPSLGGIVDLSLGALRRPLKRIHVPDAASFGFNPPKTTYNLPAGAQLAYQEMPSDWWQTAKDWTETDRRTDIVKELARAVRKGHL